MESYCSFPDPIALKQSSVRSKFLCKTLKAAWHTLRFLLRRPGPWPAELVVRGVAGLRTQVMHAYVDMLDFHDMEFDMAIRTFLAGFRQVRSSRPQPP